MANDHDIAPGDLNEINYQIARAYQTYPPGFAGPFVALRDRNKDTKPLFTDSIIPDILDATLRKLREDEEKDL